MSGFSIDWLDLRAGADRRARDSRLLQRAMDWLQSCSAPGPVRVLDLGSGTGATVRAFETLGRAEKPVAWRLVDLDTRLLAEASSRHSSTTAIETFERNLNDLQGLPLEGVRLVTASALFDLTSAGYIDALIAHLASMAAAEAVGFYAALNYDGRKRWHPTHPLDREVTLAFNRDQQRDKGFGPALGPAAADYMERQWQQHGFTVAAADSPWQLNKDDCSLQMSLLDGIAGAVVRDPAIDPVKLEHWLRFRKEALAEGNCYIGHRDILALPSA